MLLVNRRVYLKYFKIELLLFIDLLGEWRSGLRR